MAQHKSITQRVKKAKSKESKHKTVTTWAFSWEQEQMKLINRLDKAIKDDDFDQSCIAVGELRASSSKKFDALPKVLTALIDCIPNDDS